MYKFISGFLLTALLVSPVSETIAQNVTPRLDMNNSGEAGHVPVIRRPVTANQTNRIDLDPVNPSNMYDSDPDTLNVDINRVYSAMGCAALDTQEARRSALDIGEDITDEIYATALGRYMTTTLFANPQNVAVFETLEKYSSDRVRELQDRCAAVEYKDDLAPAQWEAVQQCIQKQTESAMTAPAADRPNEAEALAAAFKACLSGPTYEASIYGRDQNWLDPSINLKREMAEVLTSEKWGGTLYNALSKTSACMRGGGNYTYCGILSFIPNFRWCTGTDRFNEEGCNDSDPDVDNLATNGPDGSRVLMSPEAVSPMQIFEMSMGLSEHFVNYAMTYASGLLKTYSMQTVEALAGPGENLNANYHIKSLEPRASVLNGTSGSLDTYPINTTPTSIMGEIAQYLNCSAYNASGDAQSTGAAGVIPEWENFDEITNLDSNANPELPLPIPSGVIVSGDYIESVPELSDRALLEGDISTIGWASGVLKYGTSAGPGAPFVDTAIVQTVTMCVMRHDLRLSLSDYVTLVGRKDIKDAALIGYRRQVAYATTRYILNYLVDKLRIAQMEMSLMVATDPNLPPPHVRLTLQTVIDSLNDKIERMEQMRKQQTDYAEKIAAFRK